MANTYLDMQLDSASTWGSPYTAEEFTARVEAGEDVMGLDNSTLSGITKMIEIGGTGHDPRAVLNELKVGNDAPLREIGSAIQESGRSGAGVTYEVGAAVHTGWVAENLYRMDKKIENGQGGQYDQFCQIGMTEQAKDVKIMLPILEVAGIDTRGWEKVASTAEPEPMSSFVGRVADLAPDYKNYAPEQVAAFANHHGVSPESVMSDTDKDEHGPLANENGKDNALLDKIVQKVDSEDVRENVREYLNNAGNPNDIKLSVERIIGNAVSELDDTVENVDQPDKDDVEPDMDEHEQESEDSDDPIAGSVD